MLGMHVLHFQYGVPNEPPFHLHRAQKKHSRVQNEFLKTLFPQKKFFWEIF
jgi:hypothetical protein